MDRSNKMWLTHLKNESSDRQLALSDLQISLMNGLRGALGKHLLADNAFMEDVVQDSIIRILERIHQFEGRSRFMTWATSIAIRIAMTELRHRRWKDISFDEVTADSLPIIKKFTDNNNEPNVQREKNAIIEKMYEVIKNNLTEKQRLVLIAELREMPQDEIARHISSNRNAVYKLTHDARKKLKLGLEAAGYSVDDIRAVFTN